MILGDDGSAVIEIPTLNGWSLLILMLSLLVLGVARLRR
ncbi:MAG: IPTL-CTERM sorting domain-containing protein [Thermoanaerobaculia bacterium]|nr:IPTL-CTERM sorting domain-containing protein [Thermoanaerobaculia bacterium]